MGGDAGLVAGGGGEVGHVLLGGHLLVLVNCGQILEHHLLPGRLLATTTPRPRLLAWMDGSARRHAVQVAAQAQQQDQISRAG